MWIQIKGYENYRVNRDGEILNEKNLKLKPFIDRYGYFQVGLSRENKKKNFTIHRLVANAFLLNEQNLPQINHKDGNKKNNSVSNLEWCTGSDNVKHSFANGLSKKIYGSKSNNAKLTEKLVKEMREIYKKTPSMSFEKLGKMFNVSKTGASNIIYWKYWNRV